MQRGFIVSVVSFTFVSLYLSGAALDAVLNLVLTSMYVDHLSPRHGLITNRALIAASWSREFRERL